MVRSAAKNHERVAVVVDPADYAACSPRSTRPARSRPPRASRSRARPSRTPPPTTARSRRTCGRVRDARRAARRLPRDAARRAARWRARFATARTRTRRRRSTRRRRARPARRWRAPRCCRARSSRSTTSWTSTRRCASAPSSSAPAASIVKHNNPCGVGDLRQAGRRLPARARDRSGVGVRRHRRPQPPVDGELARELTETFLECVIAPAFDAGRAADRSPPRRTCACWSATSRPTPPGALEVRSVAGGFLVQTRDRDTAAARGGEGRHEAPADARRAARSRVRLARLQARQVERHRVRGGRPDGGHRRRPDVARRFGAHRRVEGAGAAGRVGASRRTPSSRSATASTRRPRRAPPP